MDKSPGYVDKVITSEEFYFEYGRIALLKWLNDFNLSPQEQDELQVLIKNYDRFCELSAAHKFTPIREIFFEIVSYCDLHANGKLKYNKYDDKRTLARSAVRMPDWFNHIFVFKYDRQNTSPSVKNALNMLLEPKDNLSYLSEGHRNKISEKYLGKPYNSSTFANEITEHFSKDIDRWAKNAENNSLLISRRIFDLEKEWNITELTFSQYVKDFKKYVADKQLPFIFDDKRRTKKYFWISDVEGYFLETPVHYEIIIDNGEISVDLHLEGTKKQNLEIAKLLDPLPPNLELKAWQSVPSISHVQKFTLTDGDLVEQTAECLIELFDKTYPLLIQTIKTRYPLKSLQMNTSDEIKEYAELLSYKKQIILKGPPGTGKTRMAEKIAQFIIADQIDYSSNEKFELTKDTIKNYIKPGMTIPSKSGIIYTVQEIDEVKIGVKSDKSKVWYPSFNNIIRSYNEKLYKGKNRGSGFRPYEDAIAIYLEKNIPADSLAQVDPTTLSVDNSPYYKIVQFHPSYSYEDFVRGIIAKPSDETEGIVYEAENKLLAEFANTALDNENKNYILVIDEINRANLSSVLGELIYALEYRDKEVDSMYQIDGDNTITLPSNLLIIGTMNTADRSVGHIDYAIRRRFSFVEILPKNLEGQKDITFDSTLFNKVAEIFENHTSEDFRINDVQLGHSYFIDKTSEGGPMNVRLKYEIKPILMEYVQDGILKESAIEAIENL